jgi:hypothetical protein
MSSVKNIRGFKVKRMYCQENFLDILALVSWLPPWEGREGMPMFNISLRYCFGL